MQAPQLAEGEKMLYGLAPLELPNYRVQRYHGDSLCLPITAFMEEDQTRLRVLYELLQKLYTTLSARGGKLVVPLVVEFLQGQTLERMMNLTRELGHKSMAASPSPELAKTIHDVRGGGLTPLLGQLGLVEHGRMDEHSAESIYYLTRDHLKIMRNALLGLDDVQREKDLLYQPHGTDLLVEKWQGMVLRQQGREVRLEVVCPEGSAIGECCMEFGAVDRILYNLMSNGCRHAVGSFLRLVIIAVPDGSGPNLRFILLNQVSEQDQAHLKTLKMETLFEEGISTTGSGYGLSIVGEFVSIAYGLPSLEETLAGGYLGAKLLGDYFAAWFHWPRVPAGYKCGSEITYLGEPGKMAA